MLYIANIRLPTEKAHGAQIMKMCEAFAKTGIHVTLLATDRTTPITDDPYMYYGVSRNFTIERVAAPDLVRYGRLGFLIHASFFSLRAAIRARSYKPDVVYGRDEIPLFFCSLLGLPVVWETHLGRFNIFARMLSKRALRIIAISNGLGAYYQSLGVPAGKIIVAHDGVDLSQFSNTISKLDARKKLELPEVANIAMYIGALEEWKGYRTFLEASTFGKNVEYVVVGGTEKQIEKLKMEFPHVRFLGSRPYREIADTQMAADVLVVPNTGRNDLSARFTSPMKLFTYMASGIPIIASDVPSVREVLREDVARLVPADDPEGMARAMENTFADLQKAQKQAENAKESVLLYTWDKRATMIQTEISHLRNVVT